MQKIITYLLPEFTKDQTDIYEYKNRRLFMYIMLVTIFALAPFTIVNIVLGKIVYSIIDAIALVLLIINIYGYKKFGNYQVSFSLQIIISTLLLATIHTVSSPMIVINLLWLPLLIVVSFYMCGVSLGKKLSSLIIIIMIIAELLPRFISLPKENISSEDIGLFTLMTLVICGITALNLSLRLISEEFKLYQTINNKNSEIQKAHDFNTTLLCTLSHDLSSPLTSIDFQIESIFSKNLNLEQPAIIKLNKISFQVNRMLEIVKQAQVFQSLEFGKNCVVIEDVNIDQAICRSILAVEKMAKEKNIKFKKNYYNKNIKIKAELTSLTNNVLNNLFSNAIKFSAPGGVIDIGLKKDGQILQLTIADHGIGIPKEILKNIFSASIPTSRSGTEGELGTGFGMPIVKMFLEKYQATIQLESFEENQSKRQGTKVIISFVLSA